ncbi:hypothetical protein SAMN05421812_1291 [Asanoa hainanensis]|uniref:Collagen triple helix repeat-containing protein n=1 Tax=Asanoa hainanensis TaxID=560556 RepID=A0A239PFL9_9ACTN|nr:hypothetical protein SAMN05421812_1291 [Asanoa hainanensis]
MEPLSRRRAVRVLSVSGLAVATLLAVGSLAQAEPEGGGARVIDACVNKATGDVRIPTSYRPDCGPFEHSIRWNVRGPRGPQGPPGPAGLTGPSQVLSETEDIPANSAFQNVSVECPDGLVPTGGGFQVDSPDLTVIGSVPLVGPGGSGLLGWQATFTNTTDEVHAGTAYILCYTAPS